MRSSFIKQCTDQNSSYLGQWHRASAGTFFNAFLCFQPSHSPNVHLAPFIHCIYSCNHHFSLLMMFFKTRLSSYLHSNQGNRSLSSICHSLLLCLCVCVDPSPRYSDSTMLLWMIFFIIFIFYWQGEQGWILWDEKARDLRDSCIKLRLCLVWSFCMKSIKQTISWSQIFDLSFNCFNFKAITLYQRIIPHFWKHQNSV